MESIPARPRLRLVTADDLPAPRPRPSRWPRPTVAVVGAVQVLLGVAQFAGFSLIDVVDGGHVSNETAAWNIAVGVALLSIARAGYCSRAVLTVMTTFVGTVALLTVSDAIDGGVGVARAGTHLITLAGCLLAAHLGRAQQPPR